MYFCVFWQQAVLASKTLLQMPLFTAGLSRDYPYFASSRTAARTGGISTPSKLISNLTKGLGQLACCRCDDYVCLPLIICLSNRMYASFLLITKLVMPYALVSVLCSSMWRSLSLGTCLSYYFQEKHNVCPVYPWVQRLIEPYLT